ncbi:unnamed protein product [Mytilus edulis]|uniref:Uncharacterized protein n=1 Tax=Mytilus edulis TaxID=6550 RepID=A0A8S3UV49_MYTED|nr:unnamed protein product [Mytilus edulis]
MLVDTALYCLLIADIFNIDVSKLVEEPKSTLETTEMKEIDELYSQLSSGELSASEAGESDVLKNLEATVRRKTEILKQSRTAKLWLQYSEMVQVLRQFIIAERTGNWPIHLQEKLPFLAASGHNLYTKTAYVYLMTMQSLDEDHPDVNANVINGNHVIRCNNRYWAGIFLDLFIEQVLMRKNKQPFINTLGEKLKDGHVQIIYAEDDADLKIVLTAIEKSKQHTTTVIGEDADLLILLCYPSKDTINKIYFKSEAKQNTHKIKIWDITETRRKIGPFVCNILSFIHAFSGCDTTSRIFGQGKGMVFKKIVLTLNYKIMQLSFARSLMLRAFIKQENKSLLHYMEGYKMLKH